MSDKQPPSCRKILVIRFSSIGDIVLTTPVIRCIKKRYPTAELHFLVKRSYAPILQHNPYIDKIHHFDSNLTATIQTLKQEHFDFVVDLQRNYRSGRITTALSAPHATFPKHNIRKAVLVRLKINLLPERHIVDRYFEAVRPLGVTNDNEGLDYFIPEAVHFDTQDLPVGFENGYVAVAIGAQHATKRIPLEKIIEIGTLLFKPMVLLGDARDAQVGDDVVAKLSGKVYNACGKYPLDVSASIIAQSDCVITSDTGLMHIAAAIGKPIASLWGNTVPEFGMYPYTAPKATPMRIFEISSLKCRPCSKLGFSKCPKKHFNCMQQLSAFEIAAWVNQF